MYDWRKYYMYSMDIIDRVLMNFWSVNSAGK